MKRILSILLIATLCLGLVACNGNGDKDKAAEGSTRTIKTVKGDVEIPTSPKKIVTDYYLGEFLALDVKPIIGSPYALNNPFLKDKIDGIESLDIANTETAMEKIIAAKPDLIVTLSEADYDKFAKVAPTVLIPQNEYNPEERFIFIGDVLGKKEEAAKYMDDFKTDAEKVKPEIQKIVGDKTISFVEVWPDEIYTFGSHFARGGNILFDIWELKAPKKVQSELVKKEKEFKTISLEALPEYTGDYIFYSVLADTDSAFVDESTVWKNLPAVKNNKVKKYEQIAFMHSDPLTLKGQLKFYTDYFKKQK